MSTPAGKLGDEVCTTPAASATLPWVPLLWFGGLLILLYLPVLASLVNDWQVDENVSHGFFAPLVAGWVVWQRRQKLFRQPPVPNYWAIALIAWGSVQLLLATLGAEMFLARVAFLISLVGVIWTLCGTSIIKTLAFPLFLLVFMIPLPAIIYNQITFPLQLLASRLAEVSLTLLDIPVFREGNILELASQRLSVVEACSGIRSLLSLSFLSVVYAYAFDSKVWMRGFLLVATVPIAIAANAGRVTITGILGEYKREWAEGFFHLVEGWVIFMLALIALIGIHALTNSIYALTRRRITENVPQ